MKKRYTEEQIIKAIKNHEAGVKVDDIFRRLGTSVGTFYSWPANMPGWEVNEARRMKDLELENNKLKRILAEKLLKVETLKDVILKKW